MGEYKALSTIVVLAVYFFFFITIVHVAGSAEIIDDYVDTDINNTFGECGDPRVAFDENLNEYDVNEPSANCKNTRVAFDEEECGSIAGCSWDNATTFFFFSSGTEICDGTIDKDNLTSESWGLFTSVCELSEVKDNRTLCYNLGCSWGDREYTESFSWLGTTSSGNVISTLGDLFTFRYDFGFSDELLIINIILNFVLFFIPLFILIGSIYFMLPFAH